MLTLSLTLSLLCSLPAVDAEPQRSARTQAPGASVVEPIQGERIVWYGTLEKGRAIAAETERPILLISAAPACRNVPGVW